MVHPDLPINLLNKKFKAVGLGKMIEDSYAYRAMFRFRDRTDPSVFSLVLSLRFFNKLIGSK